MPSPWLFPFSTFARGVASNSAIHILARPEYREKGQLSSVPGWLELIARPTLHVVPFIYNSSVGPGGRPIHSRRQRWSLRWATDSSPHARWKGWSRCSGSARGDHNADTWLNSSLRGRTASRETRKP